MSTDSQDAGSEWLSSGNVSDADDETPRQPLRDAARLSLLFAGFLILVCLVGGLVIGLLALLVDATG